MFGCLKRSSFITLWLLLKSLCSMTGNIKVVNHKVTYLGIYGGGGAPQKTGLVLFRSFCELIQPHIQKFKNCK